jgi:hypothetical protein
MIKLSGCAGFGPGLTKADIYNFALNGNACPRYLSDKSDQDLYTTG